MDLLVPLGQVSRFAQPPDEEGHVLVDAHRHVVVTIQTRLRIAQPTLSVGFGDETVAARSDCGVVRALVVHLELHALALEHLLSGLPALLRAPGLRELHCRLSRLLGAQKALLHQDVVLPHRVRDQVGQREVAERELAQREDGVPRRPPLLVEAGETLLDDPL